MVGSKMFFGVLMSCIRDGQAISPTAVRVNASVIREITAVLTAVRMRTMSWAPNSWEMTTEQPTLAPVATAMNKTVIGYAAPVAARASTPRKRPAITLSAKLYSCWNTMLSSSGMTNLIRILKGEPFVMSVIIFFLTSLQNGDDLFSNRKRLYHRI